MSQFKVGDKVRVLPNVFNGSEDSEDRKWVGQVVELVRFNYFWEAINKTEDDYVYLKEEEMELVARQVTDKDIKRIKDWLGLSICAGDLSVRIDAKNVRIIYDALDKLYTLRTEKGMKMWRTLIRAHYDKHSPTYFLATIPGWSPGTLISLEFKDIPEEISSRIQNGQIRFHATVNLGATNVNDLNISNWEVD